MKEEPPIVYLVDDEPAVLKAMARLLRSEGFETKSFSSPRDFLDDHNPKAPGCVILDLAMPGISGTQLQQALGKLNPLLPIIFLTGHGDIHTGVTAMKEGAVDFLTKPADGAQVLAAVRRALERNLALRRAAAERERIEGRLALLTPREREVIPHIIAGKMNKQIAADLGTVEKTIKVHRGRVMEKLGAPSLAELVRLAEKAGIKPAT